MVKKIEIHQIDAFTGQPFQGNPAGVTFGNDLTTAEMQAIAREMNLSETAFISESDKADFNLRWFTPGMEVDLCGHATIASIHYLTENNIIQNNSGVSFDTRSGILKCRSVEGKYYMQIPVYKVNEFDRNNDEIIKALGIDINDLDDSVPFMLVENGYLYIYIKTFSALKKLKPDFKSLLKISEDKKEFGAITVFTRETIEKNSFAHLRFFAPYYSVDEDPVTGSANGPLLLVLLKLGLIKANDEDIELTFEQGDIINKRGRIGVKYSPSSNELYISGNAVTVLKGEIFF